MADWLYREGQIDWALKGVEPGKTRISVMAPRAIARQVKAGAAQAGKTVSDYVLGFLPSSESKPAAPRAVAR